ncbi:MAG TPA: cupin domain-containing protein [Tepidisphaeraceae bacterium]|nr:cupin domain-containing protein [Tepidisphaeraceae bacterium]
MITESLRELAKFDPQRFNAVTLAQTPHSKTMLVCLEPGQSTPVHRPGVDLTLLILEGHATLVAGDQQLTAAGPGAVMSVEAGQPRGIKADRRTLALVIVAPPPTTEDHREVAEHLKKGTWR